jgi:hypothetical protein
MVKWIAVLVLATSACTFFDDDPPVNTCKTNADCFRAQGETCSTTKHVCEMTIDAGVDAP